MSREPEIALVLSAEEWVDALHRHCADHGGARVRCLVLDPAVALDEGFDVLVASERWPALTRPFVDALHERGRRVLVVGDPSDGAELARRLRVDRVVATDRAPIDIVDAVVALVPREVSARAAPGDGVDGARSPESDDSEHLVTTGFVVVGGPWGAGSTETALALAGGFVQSGGRPVVVDADQLTPSIAVRLGLPLEPNLCTAVDAVAFGVGAVPGALFDLGDDWPVVLVGAPNRRSAVALAGADVVAVGDVLARRFEPVIFDVSAGPGVEQAADDVRGAVLARSRVVVAVGAADPVGVVRLIEWVEEVVVQAPRAAVHVVINRAPAGRARRAEIAHEVQRDPRVARLSFVPADARVEDAAWTASLVDRGPFARAIETVCRAVTTELLGGRSWAGRVVGGADAR